MPPLPRRVAVVGVEDASLRESFDVSAAVSVTTGEVTAESTARIELSLRTTVDAKRRLTYVQPVCGRNQLSGRTDGGELLLVPTDSDLTLADADCPVVDGRNTNCGIPPVPETVTVPAASPLTWSFDVVVPFKQHSIRGDCLVPGMYRFERGFHAPETGDEVVEKDPDAVLAFELSAKLP